MFLCLFTCSELLSLLLLLLPYSALFVGQLWRYEISSLQVSSEMTQIQMTFISLADIQLVDIDCTLAIPVLAESSVKTGELHVTFCCHRDELSEFFPIFPVIRKKQLFPQAFSPLHSILYEAPLKECKCAPVRWLMERKARMHLIGDEMTPLTRWYRKVERHSKINILFAGSFQCMWTTCTWVCLLFNSSFIHSTCRWIKCTLFTDSQLFFSSSLLSPLSSSHSQIYLHVEC